MPNFWLTYARNEADLKAAQRLRYTVFVAEMGAKVGPQDHQEKVERDRFDPFAEHLLLFDLNRAEDDQVIGAYRLLQSAQAERAGGFYSDAEFDLTKLRRSGRNLLELGRSCVHPDYRGGAAMFELWSALAGYIAEHKIEILFGVASFHGTDMLKLAEPLSYLHHRHLAPADLRVSAKPASLCKLPIVPETSLDRRRAMVATPALIKAYLRLGGCVGQDAWIDQEFNTTDICLMMDTTQMNDRQRRIYTRKNLDHRKS